MSGNDSHSKEPIDATAGAAATSEHASSSGSSAESQDEGARSGGRMTRLAGESRALFDDLREWVDLRVQLVQVEVEERIEKAANEAIAMIMVIVVGLFAVAFLLHGVAIWIGDALGGQQWGYLIVAAFLGLVTLILKTAKPDFVGKRKESSEQKAVAASKPALQLEEEASEPRTDTAEDASSDEATKERNGHE